MGNMSVERLSDMTGVDGMSVRRMINKTEKQDDPLSDTDHPTEVTTVEEMSCRKLRVEQLSSLTRMDKMSVPNVPRMMNQQIIDEEGVIAVNPRVERLSELEDMDRLSLARIPRVEQLSQINDKTVGNLK